MTDGDRQAATSGTGTGQGPSGRGDDLAMPFRAEASGINGRLVRLGPTIDEILTRHNYPLAVCTVLGEAIVLAGMLGSALKSGTRFTLQTQTDGPISLLVVDYQAPGKLRGYAAYDAERVAATAPAPGDLAEAVTDRTTDAQTEMQQRLLGRGRLAMTMDPGPGMQQYQGLVEVTGGTVRDAALTYFRQSEQLPTFLALAVAQHYSAENTARGLRWRGGGLMVQHTAQEGGRRAVETAPEGDEQMLIGEDDENWSRTRILAQTVEDHELLDPTLKPEELLFRLFHEEGVRAFPVKPLDAGCTCNRARIAAILERFSGDDIAEMRTEDGRIRVTCQFCSRDYYFAPEEVG